MQNNEKHATATLASLDRSCTHFGPTWATSPAPKSTRHLPDGKPSTITVKSPGHPIAKGLPTTFTVTQTEMYNEPFHVPEPDEVIFEET